MIIDPIKNGIVIDHVKAGKGKKIYDFLELENLTCPVALIRNVPSKKTGIKDIIKIDEIIDIDMEVLGYITPEATVSVIKDGKIESKRRIALPEVVKNVIKCKNPRCITSVEHGIEHIFKLVDKDNKTYRCIYCETKAND